MKSCPIRSSENDGSVKGGRPCGTTPTTATPRASSSSAQTASVVTATAATGPALVRISALRGPSPRRCRAGFSPRRTQNRKAVAVAPMTSVTGLTSPRCVASAIPISGRVLAARLDPENMPHLAERDQQPAGGDEARDHRMRQEIRQKPQPQQPHPQQDRARQPGQRQRRHGVAGGARLGHLADGRRRHQRHHRHRADGQRAACAEHRIQQDRHDRGVKPRLGRQPRQDRIGQRLRDQHDRDDHRRQRIAAKGLSVVAAPPVEDRNVSGK